MNMKYGLVIDPRSWTDGYGLHTEGFFLLHASFCLSFEKLIIPWVVVRLLAFYGIWHFITVFT
jgi:hypothetical protein